RPFGTRRLHFLGQLAQILWKLDRLASDRDVALLVVAEDLWRELVTASVTHADVGVDAQLHVPASQTSGRSSSVIIDPPPRSTSCSGSPSISKSGITRSHSWTAT